MEYWKGIMNWSLEKGWKCEICGNDILIWGLVHATCRCATCHTQYRMRDKDDKVVSHPICQLKPEYFDVIKKICGEGKKTIEEITREELTYTALAGK